MIDPVKKVKTIEDNLFGLYQEFNSLDTFSNSESSWYSLVYSVKQEWPAFIFGVDTECIDRSTKFKQLTQNIKDLKAPSFLIASDHFTDEKLLADLKEHNFLPVVRWPGMMLDIQDRLEDTGTNKDIEVIEVSTLAELTTWVRLANKSLFKGVGLLAEIMLPLLNRAGFTFLLSRYKGEECGTLLMYEHEESMGVYMVSTLAEFRRKGVMSALMQETIYKAGKVGVKSIVLEANAASFSSYKRLGFEHVCNFDIFWHPNKE